MKSVAKSYAIEFLVGAVIGGIAALVVYGVYLLVSMLIGAKIAAWLVYGSLGLICGWHLAKTLWPKRIKHVVPVALFNKN